MGTEGHRPAGVFWLLEEEILHKERRDFVRRQNRGVRKICRGKKTKVSRPLFVKSSGASYEWKRIDWMQERSGGSLAIFRYRSAHRASLLTAVLAEVLPGVLCVRGVQREFEDLLAVLIFSPVRWV